MLKFGFTNETGEKLTKTSYVKLVKKCHELLKAKIDKKLGKRNGHIDLVIIDDAIMKEMNKEYREKNAPTDVISFAYLEVTAFEEGDDEIIIGDIFISVDTAKKQAKKRKHSLKKEMEILFVHGLLHVFGFDHKTDKQEAEMEKWAKKILG